MIVPAGSLGGCHSVVNTPVKLSHAFLSTKEQIASGITSNLLRLSVGIENPSDLIEDLDLALRKAVSL